MGIQYEEQNTFTWGLHILDKRFGKPSKRELIIMFGYSGIGKTEYTYFVSRKNAELGNKVLYISLELPEYDMKQRICLSRAGVSKYDFQTNNYNEFQKMKMDNTWEEIEKLNDLKIFSPKDKGIESIEKAIRNGYENGVKLFVVDNLDKIYANGDGENARYQNITSKLQDIKNELDICIILVHHAKKAFNKQQAMMKAGLEGIRGSQKIIDNSTQVFEVYRDLDEDDPSCHNVTEIHQLKDTFGGPKGYIRIKYKEGGYEEIIDENKPPRKENPF